MGMGMESFRPYNEIPPKKISGLPKIRKEDFDKLAKEVDARLESFSKNPEQKEKSEEEKRLESIAGYFRKEIERILGGYKIVNPNTDVQALEDLGSVKKEKIITYVAKQLFEPELLPLEDHNNIMRVMKGSASGVALRVMEEAWKRTHLNDFEPGD